MKNGRQFLIKLILLEKHESKEISEQQNSRFPSSRWRKTGNLLSVT